MALCTPASTNRKSRKWKQRYFISHLIKQSGSLRPDCQDLAELSPACITIVCLVGIYSVRNSIFDVLVMLAAGVLGYFLRHLALPVAPFIIGMVLGLTTEASSRQTVVLFRGNMLLIFERSVAAGFWS